jgi:hypothetical protein
VTVAVFVGVRVGVRVGVLVGVRVAVALGVFRATTVSFVGTPTTAGVPVAVAVSATIPVPLPPAAPSSTESRGNCGATHAETSAAKESAKRATDMKRDGGIGVGPHLIIGRALAGLAPPQTVSLAADGGSPYPHRTPGRLT